MNLVGSPSPFHVEPHFPHWLSYFSAHFFIRHQFKESKRLHLQMNLKFSGLIENEVVDDVIEGKNM